MTKNTASGEGEKRRDKEIRRSRQTERKKEKRY
jgi:hypothetical protein